MRLALKIAYDGAQLAGWQRDPAQRTGQGLVEAALADCGLSGHLHGASRTDRGVHAWGQVAHLSLGRARLDTRGPALLELRRRLNRALPDDLMVTALALAPPRFHAQWSARGKIYRYLISTPDNLEAARGDSFLAQRSWRLPDPRALPALWGELRGPARLDEEAMQVAARGLQGRWSMAGLCSGGKAAGPRRMGWISVDGGDEPGPAGGRLIAITVAGEGFGRHQVRNLAGLLVQVGAGALRPEGLRALVEGRGRHQGPRAPGWGLSLWRVRYPRPLDPFAAPRP